MASTPPTLPQVTVTPVPSETVTGSTFTVNAGGDLQAALNQAAAANPNLNHRVVLPVGSTFSGNYVCPAKVGTGWVQVTTSALANLPVTGSRIAPATAVNMAKISTPNSGPAIAIAGNNQGWRLTGLEITTTAILNFGNRLFNLVLINGDADANGNHTSLATQPTRHIIDRCYIHGIPNCKVTRGVLTNGKDITVRDCYIDDILDSNDATGIGAYNGSGPFLYENNFSQATGQCVYFGGSDSQAAGFIPSDIVVRRNTLSKKLTWNKFPLPGDPATDQEMPAGDFISVKPALELKCAQRVLIEGNTFQNSFSWPAITFDAWNQGAANASTNPTTTFAFWSVVQDVIVRYNRVDYSTAMFQTWAANAPLRRVKFHDNLGTRILQAFDSTSYNRGAMMRDAGGSPCEDVWYDHNTCFNDSTNCNVLSHQASDPPFMTRYTLTNNIFGGYVFIEGGSASDAAYNLACTNFLFQQNAIMKLYAGSVPSGAPAYTQAAFSPPTFAAGEFIVPATTGTPEALGIDRSTGVISAGSPLLVTGTDSRQIGVDLAALNAALTGTGTPDTTAPTAPTNLTHTNASLSTITLSWTASTDNVAVGGYQIFRDGVLVGTSGDTTYVVTGLASGTSYTFTVKATDTVVPPNVSAASAPHTASTTGIPPAVNSFTESWNHADTAVGDINADKPWTTKFLTIGGAATTVKITGNKVVTGAPAAGYTFNRCEQPLTSDDQEVSVTLSSLAPGSADGFPSAGVLARISGNTFIWMRALRWDTAGLNRWQIVEIINGIDAASALVEFLTAPVAGDVMTLRCVGNQVTLLVNGVAHGTATTSVLAGRNVGVELGAWSGTDSASVDAFSAQIVGAPPADTTAPVVSITTPASNATVSGTISVAANVTDAIGVANVRLFVDGVQSGAALTVAPYTFSLNTTTLANGPHTLRVDGQDAAGNTGSASVVVTFSNVTPDTTPPTVSFTAPAANATLSGSSVTMSVTASDNTAVTSVTFYFDDVQTGAPLASAPYSYTLDTTQYVNGIHTLRADARDAAGNVTTTTRTVAIINSVTVQVEVPGPTQIVTVEVPGPTVFVDRPVITTGTLNFAGSLTNLPPGNYRAMLMVIDEDSRQLVAPPVFGSTAVSAANPTGTLALNGVFKPQGQQVKW